MDIIEEKLKELLIKCMEKKMSLDTIVQVINLSQLPIEVHTIEKLIQETPQLDEYQFRQKIGKIIEQLPKGEKE